MKNKLFLFLLLTLLPGCAKFDAFNAEHPAAVPLEDAIEIGLEESGDLLLRLPAGSLEQILGQTKAPQASKK